MGSQNAQRGYRAAFGTAFAHAVMKQACSSFAGGTLKNSVIKGLPRDTLGAYPIAKAIRDIAATFTELQEKRHLANYDLSERFKRSEVLTLIRQAGSHVANFSQLPVSDDRKFFLACLWAWKDLTNRQ